MTISSVLTEARQAFHSSLTQTVLKAEKGIPSNADKHSRPSIEISKGILRLIGAPEEGPRLAGQMAGSKFEEICEIFLKQTFLKLDHIRPGRWEIGRGNPSGPLAITVFDQYEHLSALNAAAKSNPNLAAALGSDYLIKPDVIIARHPEKDEAINSNGFYVSDDTARLTSLRATNNSRPILHASVSCKWTIRSDRAQNARSEGLNLVRNRKGRLPHICVVTGEPTPNRIASIALGTGDIDCVYHFALPELIQTVDELGYHDASEMLSTMIDGKRLRDISDLPLDLAI